MTPTEDVLKEVQEQMIENTVKSYTFQINDICQIGTYKDDSKDHDFYIVTHGPDELERLESKIKDDLVSKGLIEEEDRFDADEMFEIITGLNYISNHIWGFGDEYMICDSCGQVIGLTPPFYGWIPDYWLTDGAIFCSDCVHEDEGLTEDYMDEMTNNPKRAVTLFSEEEILKMGYTKCNKDFESGLHEHQDDNPETILEKAREMLDDDEFIFRIDEIGQFDVNYHLFSKKSEEAEA